LLLEARPQTPSNAVRSILQNSADPRPRAGAPAGLDNVHRQGAGMLDIDDAILATTKIEPGKLALGESEAGPAVRTLTIENNSGTDVTYDVTHAPALATGPSTFTPAFFNAPAAMAFSANPLTVPAGGSATLDVTITANAALASKSLYGGYIVFTPQGGGQTYRVPYAGFKGDYQLIQALVPTANLFPWLARAGGTPGCPSSSSFCNQPTGSTYSLTGNDVPQILVHLDHQVRTLRMDLKDALTGKAWHRAFNLQYVGRNSTATSFFALAWDGNTTAGNKTYTVPNGQYVIELSVLKALGDSSNPAHWETWTSPPITIARPTPPSP
jgi:hypothetical protein